jgi:hypothetical protein
VAQVKKFERALEARGHLESKLILHLRRKASTCVTHILPPSYPSHPLHPSLYSKRLEIKEWQPV